MTNKSVCTVRLLNEVSAFVAGLHGDHLEHLTNKFSVHAEGYFFNPLYKLGRWDGKINFFQPSGKTYLYLIEQILPQIAKWGYKIEIDDQRPAPPPSADPINENVFAHIMHADTGEPIVLRDYQVNGVNTLVENGYGILVASTGAGKTLLCAALVNAYGLKGLRTITIVPSQDLIANTKNDYKHCELDVGEYSGKRKELEHQHVVSTWQALKNNPAIVSTFDVVVVDECHGAKGKKLQQLLTDHAAKIAYRFGVTGTMPKGESDRMQVVTALGPIRATITAAELIERKVLSKIDINVIQLVEDLQAQYQKFCAEDVIGSKPPTYTQFKDSYFPDYDSEKSYLHRNELRLEWIALYLLTLRDAKKGNILVFVDSISLGRTLASMIPGSLFVNGEDVKKSEDRQKYYDMFKDHDDLLMFATVHIAGTGINIRRIFELVTVDIGKSFIRVIQAIGRGLRTAHDKDHVNHTDICSDLKYGKKHLKERTNYYTEARYPFKTRKVDYVKELNVDL